MYGWSLVPITCYSLVSKDLQDPAILPANHEPDTSITVNIGHTYSCGPAPGSGMLCLGHNNTKEKQTRIIQSRSWGVNLVRALQEQAIQMQPQPELIGQCETWQHFEQRLNNDVREKQNLKAESVLGE